LEHSPPRRSETRHFLHRIPFRTRITLRIGYTAYMPKTAVPSAPEQPQVAPLDDLLQAERELLHKYQLHELPEEDEVPLETHYHRLQINLLHELTYQLLKNRTDFYCGGNMFLYYDLKQAEKVIQFVQGQRRRAPYKGPDFFVVLGGVDGTKDRKRWVVWHEGGRYPDVIIEITSPSTKSKNTKDNLVLYSKVFRTREYYWYDEAVGELAGYRLQGDDYVPIVPSARGWLWSEVLGVWLGVSDLPYQGWRYRWLRFYREDGSLVLTGEEAERLLREQAEQRAEQERLLREQAERRLAELEAELKRLREEAVGVGVRLPGCLELAYTLATVKPVKLLARLNPHLQFPQSIG
jgi:Uma2 family endonuclease